MDSKTTKYPLLEEMLSVMFHQDAEIWAEALKVRDIIRAAGRHYPREYLLERLVELNSLLAINDNDRAIEDFLNASLVAIDFGGLTSREWLMSVRDELRLYLQVGGHSSRSGSS
jgi:hypothetical protein